MVYPADDVDLRLRLLTRKVRRLRERLRADLEKVKAREAATDAPALSPATEED